MRVEIVVADTGAARDADVARVAAVMHQAGAQVVEVLEGEPIVIVEATSAQLRAAIATGAVESIALDSGVQPN